ncbi:MAG: hypothetical protein KatS3mg033_2475 [Thermonema sp.]|uniref:M28 family metallopeptidase n=1 Tax=Thermonema sp. TaxID=2231181 RepID=UPI0021DD964E|nr:M20/M25/M40 family metallo-hydrolase [Thermonema sp.]GIV40675.1 MAG: hypothetical protein KatS3mg033_2475 [Thermonema sp.]
MKLRMLVCLCLCLSLGTQAQDLARVRQTIDTLCSPFMDGRGYRHNGSQKAAFYLAEEFREIGLRTFADAPNYLQPFKLTVNTFDKAVLRLNGKKLRLAYDYLPHPAARGGKGRKRLLFLDSSFVWDTSKRQALLQMKHPGRYAVVTDERSLAYLQEDSLIARKLQQTGAWIDFVPRVMGSLAPRAVLVPTFQVHDSLAVLVHASKRLRFKLKQKQIAGYPCYNVAGYVEGSRYPQHFLVITAHYDHLGSIGEVYFPGANDNASGVSMLLELARYFKAHPLPYSVAFIAFGAEEIGLKGSLHYVQHPLFPLSDIRFLLNLDLVGTGEEGITVVNGKVYEEAFRLLTRIDLQKQYVASIEARGIAANSDHYFFSRMGVPAFFIYARGGSQAYHDPGDRPQALSLAAYRNLFSLIVDFFRTLSEDAYNTSQP